MIIIVTDVVSIARYVIDKASTQRLKRSTK